MKRLPSHSRPLGIAALSLALAFAGCTKNFEKLNTDPTGVPNADLQIPTLFIPLEQEIMYMTDDGYQTAQNLNADDYCGYMMPDQTFGQALDNANYVFIDGWNVEAFNSIYTNLLGPIRNKLAKSGVQTSNPDYWAIALIIEVEAIDRITDKFGPVPYSQVGSSLVSVGYDSQQDIYTAMFGELDTAAANLNAYIAANPGVEPLAANDAIFGGDYTKWLKFANSLRLRLAMHLTKIDPATAQAQAEKALADPGGVMTDPSDDAAVQASQANGNDYNQITVSYGDNSMNASIESFLVGYNDPRLPVYFEPDTDPGHTGEYTGIRIGCAIPPKPFYSGFSKPNCDQTFTITAPEVIMTAAEVWFLKAEAALRGWNGAGDAQTDYETGITKSMQQYGVAGAAAAYIQDATSKPADYVDYLNSADNSPALTTITIKWDPNATNEQKLERIITQKWLAMYPEGQEAWTEFRRTGYPALFPVVVNSSGGTIDTRIQVRRLAYPHSEATLNPKGLQQGISLLGGPDNGGTRLWWDVNGPNF
ncbi:MAG TPA: SusD/RagB family nutrient-binding outer membrane lipoprotein [Dinghuibacter sp.]|uniref:SusD/RagB family nutrient-binding outer membrane lipoprotein n=1 Tax=Dinghuibacter sp. TaxID=2024697 RepID=UPI002CF95E8A|nr:SusD/RagB family nutrient-binding outer membrane lipoprotein [Dinghuibacter sp.]HTJ10878.1 SusD/RagB family nutrient-binding outer membrane lipoprotein [Dinghuibacter sp.]